MVTWLPWIAKGISPSDHRSTDPFYLVSRTLSSSAGRWRSDDLVAACGLLFTAQPEALAFVLAGASGWAVNDEFNSLLAPASFEASKNQTLTRLG